MNETKINPQKFAEWIRKELHMREAAAKKILNNRNITENHMIELLRMEHESNVYDTLLRALEDPEDTVLNIHWSKEETYLIPNGARFYMGARVTLSGTSDNPIVITKELKMEKGLFGPEDNGSGGSGENQGSSGGSGGSSSGGSGGTAGTTAADVATPSEASSYIWG